VCIPASGVRLNPPAALSDSETVADSIISGIVNHRIFICKYLKYHNKCVGLQRMSALCPCNAIPKWRRCAS
jgi:hypothetical protein